MEYILLLVVLLLYLLPGIIAGNRGHPQAAPIIIINIFFGWTLLGWVVALAWASSAIAVPVAPIAPAPVAPAPLLPDDMPGANRLDRWFENKIGSRE